MKWFSFTCFLFILWSLLQIFAFVVPEMQLFLTHFLLFFRLQWGFHIWPGISQPWHLEHGTHSCLLVQRKYVVYLLFSSHFSCFLWPFVKSVSICCVVRQFFCCLHVFDLLFFSTGVSVVWPFFQRWKLLTCMRNNKFFIVRLLRLLLC